MGLLRPAPAGETSTWRRRHSAPRSGAAAEGGPGATTAIEVIPEQGLGAQLRAVVAPITPGLEVQLATAQGPLSCRVWPESGAAPLGGLDGEVRQQGGPTAPRSRH